MWHLEPALCGSLGVIKDSKSIPSVLLASAALSWGTLWPYLVGLIWSTSLFEAATPPYYRTLSVMNPLVPWLLRTQLRPCSAIPLDPQTSYLYTPSGCTVGSYVFLSGIGLGVLSSHLCPCTATPPTIKHSLVWNEKLRWSGFSRLRSDPVALHPLRPSDPVAPYSWIVFRFFGYLLSRCFRFSPACLLSDKE